MVVEKQLGMIIKACGQCPHFRDGSRGETCECGHPHPYCNISLDNIPNTTRGFKMQVNPNCIHLMCPLPDVVVAKVLPEIINSKEEKGICLHGPTKNLKGGQWNTLLDKQQAKERALNEKKSLYELELIDMLKESVKAFNRLDCYADENLALWRNEWLRKYNELFLQNKSKSTLTVKGLYNNLKLFSVECLPTEQHKMLMKILEGYEHLLTEEKERNEKK